MKQLFRVETIEFAYYVVAENITQVVNQHPTALRIEIVCDTNGEYDQRLKLEVL